jgi:hypothetical protein
LTTIYSHKFFAPKKIELGEKGKKILKFCRDPKSSREILDFIGVSYHSKNVTKYVSSLIDGGFLYYIIPDAPFHKNQKYFSELVGTTMVGHRSIGASHDPYSGEVIGISRQISESYEPIIRPHEFGLLKDVVLVTPRGVFMADKTPFHCNKQFFLHQGLLPSKPLSLEGMVYSL